MKLALWDFQTEAFNRARQAVRDGHRRILIVSPTGSGKSVIGAALMESVVSKGGAANFVVDRLSLINQTSRLLDNYGIPHGIVQADHERNRPTMPVQLCSIHTLLRRAWPGSRVDIFDEAHILMEEHKRRMKEAGVITIGLTATPFTKGLAKFFDTVINVATTRDLINRGFLAPYRIFSYKEPDMTGVAVKSTGEWDEEEASKRALEVVGDVVKEYMAHAEGRKFICSAVDTKHVQELQRQFLAAGINAATYTYKDKADDRADVLEEFRRPNSLIRGLITVTAASRGFDQPDVSCIIMARPLRKSLAEHIQLLGRGLRTAPGKVDGCVVLDHSGNAARFWNETEEFFEFGMAELDDGKPKRKPPPKRDPEKEGMKCPSCGHLHKPAPFCPACFAAGSLVLTSGGWLPIEEVRIGMLVLTHRGRWRPVVDTITREAKVLEVTGLGHPRLLTTADHPLLTRDGWISAREAKEWASPAFIERFPVSHVPYEMSPSFCRLIGCFLGDGYTSIKRRRQQPGQEACSLVITCGHTEHEISRVAETIEEAGFKGTMKKVRTGHIFTVYSADLARWLRAHFGVYSHGKFIPPWVHGLDEKAREALLAGYLEADGYRAPTGVWHANTVSKALAFGVKLLAQSLGYGCRLYREAPGTTTIEGRQYAAREKWKLVGKPHSPTSGVHTRGRTIVAAGGHHFAPIRKRVERDVAELVYDLTVEEDHSYVVEGIVVHNCGHQYPPRKAVQHVPGTLKELISGQFKRELIKELWPQVCGYAHQSYPNDPDRAGKFATAVYIDLTGSLPDGYWYRSTKKIEPTTEVRNMIKAKRIAYFKRREGKREAKSNA